MDTGDIVLRGKRHKNVYNMCISFLPQNTLTFEKFVAFIKKVEKRVGHSLVCVRSDNGTEFENSCFIDFCNEHGVEHNFSAPRTPQ